MEVRESTGDDKLEKGENLLWLPKEGFGKNSESAFHSWETECISYLLLPNTLPQETQQFGITIVYFDPKSEIG